MKRNLPALLALGIASSCIPYRRQCELPAEPVNTWVLRRIDKWPGLSFRLPSEFKNDYPNGPWFGPGKSQFAIQFIQKGIEPIFQDLPTSKGRPEYTRCDLNIDGSKAAVVSYNLWEDVGDLAFVGPLQSYAQIELPNGERVLVYSMTDDRKIHDHARRDQDGPLLDKGAIIS